MSHDKAFDGSDAHLLPSSPAECAAYLRSYNAWRRGDDSIEQPHPKELGFVIAMAAELIEQRGELLTELKAAHQIIKNALSVMTIEQKAEWGRLNERDGVEGEGVTRANERAAVISKAGAA